MSPESGHRASLSDAGEGAANSAAQPQPSDQLLVSAGILALQIVEQAAALPDHDEQPATRMEILLVRAEMLGQVPDPLAQAGDLDLGRPGVGGLRRVFVNHIL